ncbi:MAG: cytidylate kinase [Flavobacteriales bacterium]|nr:cytidylate kinase [Flavobacteriales bacterium]MBO73105.1 cytidylate kinase [Flavobacteriales bacterium]|tara:strand:+ start:756 stop:1466 length:711 start_codon:yes stop_codon:yes gene_type:complete
MKKITIAIDGFSSCGKSTLAKELAKRLSYSYVDTGAMFRAVALYCLRNGLIKEDGTKVYKIREFLDEFQIGFEFNEDKGFGEVTLNGENVEEEIRTLTISRIVTKISGIKEVREKLLVIQKKIGSDKGVVLDGRDIGTVVFPDAELKIFMTAETTVRAKRRLNELKGKGHKVSLEEVEENLRLRDYDDTTREESPLKQAEDAVVIDNTNLTRKDQLSMIVALAKERMMDEEPHQDN